MHLAAVEGGSVSWLNKTTTATCVKSRFNHDKRFSPICKKKKSRTKYPFLLLWSYSEISDEPKKFSKVDLVLACGHTTSWHNEINFYIILK